MHVSTDEDDLMTLELGESLARPGKRRVTVTPQRFERLPQLRRVLIEAARQQRTITYSEASAAADDIAPNQSMGEVMDLIGLDCRNRREPNLAALAVKGSTREVGVGYTADAVAERLRCFEWWAHGSTSRALERFEVAARDEQQRLVRERQGQQEFRALLLAAYGGACAVTSCAVPAALQAAHIDPYDGEVTNVVVNGLLLRADVHNLFDLGLLWVEDGFVVQLDESLRHTEYDELRGRTLTLPASTADHPDHERLAFHRRRFGRRDTV